MDQKTKFKLTQDITIIKKMAYTFNFEIIKKKERNYYILFPNEILFFSFFFLLKYECVLYQVL